MAGWKVNGKCVVGCFSIEEYEERPCNAGETVIITSCQGAFLKQLTNPALKPGVTEVEPEKTSFDVEFQDQKISWDGYDLLLDKQKLCEFCFFTGTMILLRHCDPHKKNFKRSVQIEAAKIATKRQKIFKVAIQSKKTKHAEFACDTQGCQKIFSSKALLTSHKKIHGEKKFFCEREDCEYKCFQKKQLKQHELFHLGIKKYKCDWLDCGKEFATKSEFNVHTKRHTKQGWFKCEFEGCEKSFAQTSALTVHLRTHTLEKPYQCPEEECDYAAATSSAVVCHVRANHTGERPYVCLEEGCGATFAKFGTFQGHQAVHSGVKKFECQVPGCGKKYQQSNGLRFHMMMHNGEKNETCTVCGAKFAKKGNLRRHMLTHSDDNPFSCEHCNFKCKRRDELRKHEDNHEKQKAYKFECKLQDGGLQDWQPGDVPCTIRCETALHLSYHIQCNHTVAGLAAKHSCEQKLADFFKSEGIPFDRDWTNRLEFDEKVCGEVFEGRAKSARPDFHLIAESARLGAKCILDLDEFCHRFYPCELQRTYNVNLSVLEEKLVYFRFNPHFYSVGGVRHDHPLERAFQIMLKTIRSIQPEDLNPKLSLIYIHYDRDEQGELDLYTGEGVDQTNHAVKFLKDSIIKIV
jgi:hypothetical protein